MDLKLILKNILKMNEYYVGEELPREHYLQSKKDHHRII